jgi:hypothetical protein
MKQFNLIRYKHQSKVGDKIIGQLPSLDEAINQLCKYLINQDFIQHPNYGEFWSQKINQIYSMNLLPKQSKRGVIQLSKDKLNRFLEKHRLQLIKVYRQFELTPCKPTKNTISGMRYKCYLDRELNQYYIRESPASSQHHQEKQPAIQSQHTEERTLDTGTDPLSPITCRCECCQAMTKKGHLCRNKALHNGFCWMHQPKM